MTTSSQAIKTLNVALHASTAPPQHRTSLPSYAPTASGTICGIHPWYSSTLVYRLFVSLVYLGHPRKKSILHRRWASARGPGPSPARCNYASLSYHHDRPNQTHRRKSDLFSTSQLTTATSSITPSFLLRLGSTQMESPGLCQL